MPMIENIAKGRVQKFLKENCLVDQEFQFGDGDKATVAQWLAKQDKDLKITYNPNRHRLQAVPIFL